MNEVANNEDWFSSYCTQNPVVIKQTSLSSSFITSETVYQYTSYVEYVANTVFRIIKKYLKKQTILSVI
jgi:hypothetical protein